MNRRVDDYVAHEPDWFEVAEAADWHCRHCGGETVFVEYDSFNQEILVRCFICGETDWHSTEPDPDGGHDSEF